MTAAANQQQPNQNPFFRLRMANVSREDVVRFAHLALASAGYNQLAALLQTLDRNDRDARNDKWRGMLDGHDFIDPNADHWRYSIHQLKGHAVAYLEAYAGAQP